MLLSGEAMAGLWGALRSVVRAGDRVVSACNGVYGSGIADMAAAIDAVPMRVEGSAAACIPLRELTQHSDWQQSIDAASVVAAIAAVQPALVTCVHCDTPSGMWCSPSRPLIPAGVLNNLSGIGRAARDAGALLLVDFVSSAAAVPVHSTTGAHMHSSRAMTFERRR